jgi:hypothetical protein
MEPNYSYREDLIALQELQKSNDRSLEKADENVKTYSGRVESVQDVLD